MIETATPSTPMPAVTTSGRLHLDFLDGIRGLAALSVVIHHLYIDKMGMSARSIFPNNLGNVLLYGHLAVGVFLVVSGFCLGLPVASTRQLARGAVPFYGKRARRILPPFFVALFASVVLYWARHRFAGGGPVTAPDFISNLLLLQDVFPRTNVFNPPLWSVAVEWKIYFLFPLFLWVWRRMGTAALITSGFVLGASGTVLWAVLDAPRNWGHSCPWFLGLFALGVAAAGLAGGATENAEKWCVRLPPVALTAAIVLLGLVWCFPVTGRGEYEYFVPALPLIDTATGVFSAALMVLLARAPREGSALKRALEWRPLVFMGSFAYSLYLTHEPMIRVLMFVLDKLPVVRSSPSLATIMLFGVGLPFLLILGFLFFVAFERPFLSRRSGS